MNKKLKNILDLIDEYITEKHRKKKWIAGKDWIHYSGHIYDSDEYMAGVNNLLNEWLTFGKDAREFEKQFPKYVGKKLSTMVNSGSSANLLMLAAMMSDQLSTGPLLYRGDKIITPISAFPTTVNPIIQLGLNPVFVDVDIPSLNLKLDNIEQIIIKSNAKAIMFAHSLGNPPDMDKLMKLAHKYDLLILEDACDALGSTYKGKKLGSFGLVSSNSFYPAHHITTGEGGMINTNSIEIKKIIDSLRDWGKGCFCNTLKPGDVTNGTACGNRFQQWFNNNDIVYDHRYVFNNIGYNLKPIDLQGALGLAQLKKLPMLNKARRKNFKKLYKIFEPYKKYFYMPEATSGANPCWFAFMLIIKASAPFERIDIVKYLENAKIQTRPYFSGNLLYHPGYQKLAMPYKRIQLQFPNADMAAKNTFFLGTYAGITDEKLNYIKKTIDTFMENYSEK